MNFESKNNIEVGTIVFYLQRIKRIPCPLCDGYGTVKLCNAITIDPNDSDCASKLATSVVDYVNDVIEDKADEYVCPKCKGKKTIKLRGQPKYQVAMGTVQAINVNADMNGTITSYCIADHLKAKDGRWMLENEFFTDIEDAQKECEFLNLERRIIPLDGIKVPRSFAATIPMTEKLMNRVEEWRRYGKFETEIFVDNDMNLFDGYTSYLVYRMFGVPSVPVVIWPNNPRFKTVGVPCLDSTETTNESMKEENS